MPILSILLTSSTPVHFYHGSSPPPFSPEQEKILSLMGVTFTSHAENFTSSSFENGEIVIGYQSAVSDQAGVDAYVADNILYITNPKKIDPAQVLVIRKRTATPVTTPVAEAMLQKLAGLPVTALDNRTPTEEGVSQFLDHLQTMCGTEVNHSARPAPFVAGLAAIGSLWVELIRRGGGDILMASTAYGGSSQLTDVLSGRAPALHKHTFDIQGKLAIVDSISNALEKLSQSKALSPITVLFVEIPTNPDMKVLDLEKAAAMLSDYKKKTQKEVVLMIDTTFAPGSKMMERVRKIDPELPVIVFISLSKSVSRGRTTGGCLVSNHTPFSQQLVGGAAGMGIMMNTAAKPDQLRCLEENHVGVEDRCQKAYEVAFSIGEVLRDEVKKHTGEDMPLRFVTPEDAAVRGLTTSTYSFNLPPLKGATEEDNAHVAQTFVDHLATSKHVKPCVSFGQDNGLVYATVPATSTQGAIKAEDKAKQSVGGVQLVRLSFPPSPDLESVKEIVRESVSKLYRDGVAARKKLN